MKLKTKPGDFRVHELLHEDYLARPGKHHVYLVQKRKMTSFEAAEVLASLAKVSTADVSMAGLKDRQGVTTQYMSLTGGRRVELERPELKIRPVGTATEALGAQHSRGNHFELRLRELDEEEREALDANRAHVAKLGVPNYFGEQRFGNLRHGQGWIARDLMLGEDERALRAFLCAESPHDSGQEGRFKSALRAAWGDWSECREIAGRFGRHHSIFEHLRKEPDDFRGAFYHVSSRLRLIHLYAYQSHLWNRVAAEFLARAAGERGACVALGLEGALVFPDRFLEEVAAWKGTLRLAGEELADVESPSQRALYEEVLRSEGLTPERLRIDGVSGFQLKGEDRRLFIKPEGLRVSPDSRSSARDAFLLEFDLPRGAYATLVVQGLLARPRPGPLKLDRIVRRAERKEVARARHASREGASPWARGRSARAGGATNEGPAGSPWSRRRGAGRARGRGRRGRGGRGRA